MQRFISIYSILLLFFSLSGYAQSPIADELIEGADDDMSTSGNDIFSDFQEELQSTQILEDERFYRYGRFFAVHLGLGMTTFSGNRGTAYHDKHPTFSLAVNYFSSFRSSFLLGIAFSKHVMYLDTKLNKDQLAGGVGAVEVNMLRPFTAYRYYFDISNLGSIFTYSNPYITGRLEYWYQTNKFTETILAAGSQEQKGGGIGLGFGGGLEFPLEVKQSYLGIEGLVHWVNFFDKYTSDYQQVENDADSAYGYADLTGLAFTFMVSLNQTW